MFSFCLSTDVHVDTIEFFTAPRFIIKVMYMYMYVADVTDHGGTAVLLGQEHRSSGETDCRS